jgi:hypothetical protein
VLPPQEPTDAPLETLSVVALRRTLRRRKVAELRRLAAEAGDYEDELREAIEESDDPKGAIVALLVAHYAKLGGHALEEPEPELSVPTLVRVRVLEGRQLKAAAPFNLSRHRDHDAFVEVQLLGPDGEGIPHSGAATASTSTPAAADAVAGRDRLAPLRGHVVDYGGAEIRGKPWRQELEAMRLFALQQICEERGLETAPGEDGREGLVRRILAAEAEAADQDRGEGSRDGDRDRDAAGRRTDSQRRGGDDERRRSSSRNRGRDGDRRTDGDRGRDGDSGVSSGDRDRDGRSDRGGRGRRHAAQESEEVERSHQSEAAAAAEADIDASTGRATAAAAAAASAAGYSASTFRRSAAWKSTVVHQSADPVRCKHMHVAAPHAYACCVALALTLPLPPLPPPLLPLCTCAGVE